MPDSTKKQWSLCFFNNKGGVGKTTLACNVSSYLAQHEGLKVLMVDADPQCNASQLILGDEAAQVAYAATGNQKTLRDVLAPLSAGEATINSDFAFISSGANRFGIDLLPGHPKVALLEDKLSQNWTNFVGGDIGGARVTNWNTQFISEVSDDYDLIVYDIGPSLGALNRAVLIGVDYFIAPMGCDIFSLIGVDNIADWLTDWRRSYNQGMKFCEQKEPGGLDKYGHGVRKDGEMSRFIGYTVQQYITKTIRQERRATGAYEQILNDIPGRIENSLSSLVSQHLDNSDLRLGDVPHMFSLVPLAQSAHAPIDGLTSKDGLSGGAFSQQSDYRVFIANLAKSLLKNLQKTSGAA